MTTEDGYDFSDVFIGEIQEQFIKLANLLMKYDIPSVLYVQFKHKDTVTPDGIEGVESGVAKTFVSRGKGTPGVFAVFRFLLEHPELADTIGGMITTRGESGEKKALYKDTDEWTEEDYKSMTGPVPAFAHVHYLNLPCVYCGHPWKEHSMQCAGPCSEDECDCQHFMHMGEVEPISRSADDDGDGGKAEDHSVMDDSKLGPFLNFMSKLFKEGSDPKAEE